MFRAITLLFLLPLPDRLSFFLGPAQAEPPPSLGPPTPRPAPPLLLFHRTVYCSCHRSSCPAAPISNPPLEPRTCSTPPGRGTPHPIPSQCGSFFRRPAYRVPFTHWRVISPPALQRCSRQSSANHSRGDRTAASHTADRHTDRCQAGRESAMKGQGIMQMGQAVQARGGGGGGGCYARDLCRGGQSLGRSQKGRWGRRASIRGGGKGAGLGRGLRGGQGAQGGRGGHSDRQSREGMGRSEGWASQQRAAGQQACREREPEQERGRQSIRQQERKGRRQRVRAGRAGMRWGAVHRCAAQRGHIRQAAGQQEVQGRCRE